MKKTLLALAVVAASGAAFAQSATLSGSYIFGYQSTKVGGVTTAGLGTDTAAIALTATEDLGGGLKATAKVSLGGMMRDGAGTGEDAFVSLSGGFGTVMMGTVETDDGLARARAGVPGIGLDGKVHAGNPPIDVLSYTSPQLAPGVTVGYSYVDRGTAITSGLAAGTTGAAFAQPSHTANVSYGAGPISARFDVTSWTRQGDASVTSNKNKNRFRVSGNYNFGVASLGLGYSSVKTTVATTVKETVIGLWAPVGAAEVGMQYEQLNNAGVKTTGTDFGVKYNLSKRTNIGAAYAQWKKDGAATTDNSFRVLIGHSF